MNTPKSMVFGLSGSGAGFESCNPTRWAALAKWAEKLGYHSLWLNEEHFQTRDPRKSARQVLSPLLVASAFAVRTRTIRLGFSVLLLPLHHPLRLAEELASLDVLSKGRVDFGVSRARKDTYLGAFGVDREASRAGFPEGIQTILDYWSNQKILVNGLSLEVQPKPVQRPHPPIYIGTYTEDVAQWVAKQGHSLIIHGVQSLEHAVQNLGWYVRAGGDPANVPFGRFTYVSESDEQARQELMPTVNVLTAFMRGIGLSSKGLVSAADLEPDAFYQKMVIAGSPESCAKRIASLRDELGIRHYNLLPGFFGHLPAKLLRPSLKRFSEHVMPRLI